MREPSSQIPNFSSIVKVQPSQFLFILQLKDEKCETAIFFSLLLACKKATTRAVHVCACVCLCVFVFVVWTILSLCVFALHAWHSSYLSALAVARLLFLSRLMLWR